MAEVRPEAPPGRGGRATCVLVTEGRGLATVRVPVVSDSGLCPLQCTGPACKCLGLSSLRREDRVYRRVLSVDCAKLVYVLCRRLMLADQRFKFNRNNGWSADTHIQVLAEATAGRTLELEASCSDRSTAAVHLVPDPLTSSTVILTLVAPVITLSVDTTEMLPGAGTVDIQARLTPAPGGGIWRDCYLRTTGGTAVAGTDYNLATESFEFNTLNNWTTETYIILLDDATVSRTIELQADCNDRSAAAILVASAALGSSALSLTLTRTASSTDLTCEEILTIARSHLSSTAYGALSKLSVTDCEKGAHGMTREEVEHYFRNAEYAPDHDHDAIEVRIWPTLECLDEAYIAAHGPCPYRISGQPRTNISAYPSGPQYPHPSLESEDKDTQETESQDQTRHNNEAIYRHEWHYAGEYQDHLQVYVDLEHHSNHYHSYCGSGAEDCSLAHIIGGDWQPPPISGYTLGRRPV